jgi:ElaB/YqjD/DUF883 family membrane-anchored ribosome-binding protein
VLLKVRLDDVRAILKHALDTVAEHPEILTSLTRALEDLVTGRIGDALGTVENVLGGLEDNGTVDDLLKGRLENVRDTLQEVLSQVGEQAGGEGSPARPYQRDLLRRPVRQEPRRRRSEEGKGARLRMIATRDGHPRRIPH